MQLLKIGADGPDVVKLQNLLIKQGWLDIPKPTGFFAGLTDAAVRRFQRANDLVVDGRVGAITWAALSTGVTPNEPAPHEGDLPSVPRNRTEVKRIFGSTKSAVESQLAFCEVPLALKAFSFKGTTGKRGFTCHRLLVPAFQAVFNEIAAAGLADKIYSYEGVFNWRAIRGSSNMSLHSYAIAIDLNYEGNTLGDSTPAMDQRVVAIFKKHKFFWGGDYGGRKDGMHFEWYRYS